MIRKEKGMEAEIKKRIIGNVDKFASGFIAKNIQICICTYLYFLGKLVV
jgi:hypothetical protein